MFDWFWGWYGYHVCEEFTQWETREVVARRPASLAEQAMHNVTAVRVNVRLQERRCTVCGIIQQRKLDL